MSSNDGSEAPHWPVPVTFNVTVGEAVIQSSVLT
jgi:hypothetical protein